MNQLTTLSIRSLSKLLVEKKTTSFEICQAFLAQAKANNPELGALIDFNETAILQYAEASDKRWAKGAQLSQYDGLPIAIKDNISVAGEPCRCASKMLEKFTAVFDATAIIKLKKMGFIPLGRCNMDEFAMGSTTKNSAFLVTKNPHDLNRIPGGSSGGSAAVIAAGFAPVSLGSDTGGSIRQPAGFCGVVGFKPGYGTVSRYGLVAFASSLDQIGPLAHTVEDCALIYDIIRGKCDHDATTINEIQFDPTLLDTASLKGVKVGLPKEYFDHDGLPIDIKNALNQTIEKMKSLGAEMVEVSVPHAKYAIATYYVLATAEASANLARFDGIRYGHRANASDLISTYAHSREEGFGLEVKRRIILGTYVLSSGYYDAYYIRAQKVRTLIHDDFQNAMKQCDVLLAPISPEIAPRFDDPASTDPMKLYLADIFTTSLNLWGGCGLAIPVAKDSKTNMPIGIQLMASPDAAQTVFNVGAVLQNS